MGANPTCGQLNREYVSHSDRLLPAKARDFLHNIFNNTFTMYAEYLCTNDIQSYLVRIQHRFDVEQFNNQPCKFMQYFGGVANIT